MILAALLLAVSSSAPLEATVIVSVPFRTEHHNLNRLDYTLYGGVVAYRIGDYFSTEHALSNGGREAELPQVFVDSKASFAVYSAGMAALEIAGSVYLHRHGHAKLARFADVFSISAGIATDIHNIGAVRRVK